MSMSHKAYAFDWKAFQRDELVGLLHDALATDDPASLIRYIENNRNALRDPYEGEPLPVNWRDMLENNDVQEFGDYALTRFYDPGDDWGMGNWWSKISNRFPPSDRNALAGFCVGPENNPFNPGRQASCFQTPEQVKQSLGTVEKFDPLKLEEYQRKLLATFKTLLEDCVEKRLGLYVTF